MLPILKIAKQDITLPDSKKVLKIRPYLTGEEKGLLMAIESKDAVNMQEAIRNLVEACVLTEGFVINDLSFMDLEFVFINLRKISVGKIVTLQLFHEDPAEECKHIQKVDVDLDKMTFEGALEKKIVLEEEQGIGIVMKTPTVSILESLTAATDIQKTFDMIYACVDYVFDAESVYKDFTQEDLRSWIDQLNEGQLKKIMGFFDTIPKITYHVEYECSECKKIEKRNIEGILSFL